MANIRTVYLSGPDAFAPDASTLAVARRDACTAAGFTAVQAGDDALTETEPSEVMARELYADTLAKLRAADALIVNLSPWRGPGADPGAAFEAGFAAALGKPVLAYMNIDQEDDADHRDRVESWIGAVLGPDGVWRDGDGCLIEDYGLPERVMLWAEARRFYVIVTPEPLADITGLELCLEALKLYAD